MIGLDIIFTAAFGFALELRDDGCYFASAEYKLFIDGKFEGCYRENIIAVFGLASGRLYHCLIESEKKRLEFKVQTEKYRYRLNVKDFGAKGDGLCSDSAAINMAIYTAEPGSVVCVPRGRYLIETIFLKSSVDLYLEAGAELLQNTKRSDLAVIQAYPRNYDFSEAELNCSWEGNPLDSYGSLIYGKNVENVRIYGPGRLNGQGREGGWWEHPKQKNIAFRPKNILLVNCRAIQLCGFSSVNSASWNIHPLYCTQIKLTALHLESEIPSPNTDGINPESSTDVCVLGCSFALGDDCIAIKSGKLYLAETHHRPSQRIAIRNCYMQGGHAAVAIGSESAGGVSGVEISQCLFEGTDRGLRIKTRRGRGSRSRVEQITLRRVRMRGVQHCIVCNMHYFCDPDGHSLEVRSREAFPLAKTTPTIADIELEDLQADEIRGCGVFIYALKENPMRRLSIKNSSFSFSAEAASEAPDMLDDFTANEDLGVFIENLKELNIENTHFHGPYLSCIEGREEHHA